MHQTRFRNVLLNFSLLVDWCGDPPEVPGAAVTITGHNAGSVASYSCHQGFVSVGGQQVSKNFICVPI